MPNETPATLTPCLPVHRALRTLPRAALSPRDMGAPTPFRIRTTFPFPHLPPTALATSEVVLPITRLPSRLFPAPGPGPRWLPPPPAPGAPPAVPSSKRRKNASGISRRETPPALTLPRLNGPYRVLASRFTVRHRCLQIFRICRFC